MKTPFGHLTYCSNIHPGITWADHYSELKQSVPQIKAQLSSAQPMALGLRLANQASIDLIEPNNLENFKNWLAENNLYVFTMNGFPYGGFHNTVVKDQVHAPDWTTSDRLQYTLRMFHILAKIMPEDMIEGGISTSPLSYKYWWKNDFELNETTKKATMNMLLVVEELIKIETETGKILHLDIEPEPDGVLDNGHEFIRWYLDILLPLGIKFFENKGKTKIEAEETIKKHIQLCYDVCHFGVSYIEPQLFLNQLFNYQIKVGKIQISSALKVDFTENAEEKLKAISQYDEPTYLHQVVTKKTNGKLENYVDLTPALANFDAKTIQEWRVQYHVPIFTDSYGLLQSTQNEIVKVLSIQKNKPFTQHLEVETYTWAVLPTDIQIPLNDSICREMSWVKKQLDLEYFFYLTHFQNS